MGVRVNLVDGVVGALKGAYIQGLAEITGEENIQGGMVHLRQGVVRVTVFLCVRMDRKETATFDSLYASFSQVIMIYMMEMEVKEVCVL